MVRSNGQVVVVYNNGNTPSVGGQQLAIVSSDGGQSFSAPTPVGADIATGEPQCDFGRGPEECIPGDFYRADDFPLLPRMRVGEQPLPHFVYGAIAVPKGNPPTMPALARISRMPCL